MKTGYNKIISLLACEFEKNTEQSIFQTWWFFTAISLDQAKSHKGKHHGQKNATLLMTQNMLVYR